MSSSRFFLFLFCLFSLASPGALLAQGDRDVGAVVVRPGERGVIPVAIASEEAELRRLAEQAFGAHGGFQLVRERAAFTFTFRSAGSNRVTVEITSGNPPQVQFRETVSGENTRNALFRAADLAAAKTTGQRGFFAGRLTFIGERTGHKEVYTADLFLGEVVRQTNDRSESVTPRWARDGRRILYTTYFQSGFPDIYQIDLVGRSRSGFVTKRGTNTGARFSPDGSRIAMILSGEGNPEVYVSNSAGQQIRRLTRTNGAVQASPTWSPDGTRLAFVSDRDGRPQLFVIPSSGGTMRRIPTNISGNCTEPDWNPVHDNLIAFTAATSGRFAVAVFDFTTGQSRFVTRESGDAIEPVWLADGRHLIYTARTARSKTLMLLDTQTGQSTRLSSPDFGKVSQADFWIRR